jgi:hypothetical protein
MPITNPLETARRLTALGFSPQQAEGVAQLLEETAKDIHGDLATKDFVRAEIAELRTELKTEIADLRTGLKTDIANLRAEMRGEFRQQLMWFFSIQIALLSAAVALLKVL